MGLAAVGPGRDLAHLLGIAVIRGDEDLAPDRLGRRHHPPQAAVHHLDGLDGGLEVARVADHVGVGIVADDDVVPGAHDGLDQAIGDGRGAHLGRQVIGRDMRRGHQHAVFPREHALLAAVEEEGHVGILLGLGDAQLGEAAGGDVLAEDMGQPLGRIGHRAIEVGMVPGQGDEGPERDAGPAQEAIEAGLDEGPGQLPGPIGPVVHEHQDIARADLDRFSAARHDGGRLQELVGLPALIGHVERDEGIGRAPGRLAAGDQAIGRLGARPALVAVHGVVTADQRGDPPPPQGVELDLGELDGLGGALGRTVAAVQEGMQVHLARPRARGQLHHRQDMVLVAVDPARRQQAQDMDRRPAAGGALDGLDQGLVVEERAVLDGAGDAGEVLHHQPPGPDVHMPDLGIAHLLVGQADVGPRAADQGVGIERPEVVPDRLMGALDRVVLDVVAVPPTVQDQEDERSVGDRHVAPPLA
jgi:hypothetical protein